MSKRNVFSAAMRLTLIALVAWAPGAGAVDQAELTAFLEEIRSEMNMPGVRAAVRYGDGRIVRAAVGLADKARLTPLDDTVGMPGGSTGKTFCAALTMLLVEDGTLSLDDNAATWLGDERWFQRIPNSESIKVRHLLSHTAGIGDYPGSVRFNLKMVGRVLRHGSARFEPEELIRFATKRRALNPVGEGYSYSDAGYLVLGRVIEAATGRDYYDLLTERVIEPQRLVDVRPQDQSVMSDVAIGYMAGAPSIKKDGRMKFDPSSEWTGGGLITNPTMLVEFYAALAEGRIVSSESFRLMLDSGWRDPAQPDWHYGFGLFVSGDGMSFGHGGLWPGYRTQVIHDLGSGVTVAVQTNRDGRLDMVGLARRLLLLGMHREDKAASF